MLKVIEEKCQKRDSDLAVLDERQGSEMSAAVDRANMDQAEEVLYLNVAHFDCKKGSIISDVTHSFGPHHPLSPFFERYLWTYPLFIDGH